jgi:hypothetical protein
MKRMLRLAFIAVIAGCAPPPAMPTGAQQLIGPEGGTLEIAGGARVVVPPGALAAPVMLSLSSADASHVGALPGTAVGGAWLLGPEGQQFAAPVELTLPYDPNAVPAGEALSSLRVAIAPQGTSDFALLSTSADSIARTLTAVTLHFSIVAPIAPANPNPIFVTTTTLPPATVGAAYGPVAVQATGGAPPYTFSAPAAPLPPGLTLSTGGAIAGTPTAAGSYAFTVRVKDSASSVVDASLTLVVQPGAPALPVVTAISPTSVSAGAPDTQLTVSGANFTSATTAVIGTQALSTHFVSAGQLLALVPASYLAAPGTVMIGAFTPGAGYSPTTRPLTVVATDMAMAPDLAMPDLAMPVDLRSTDLASSDLADPWSMPPDLAGVDFTGTPAHCFNGITDVNETDVDCGGPDCIGCIDGKACNANVYLGPATFRVGDCLSGYCKTPTVSQTTGVCAPNICDIAFTAGQSYAVSASALVVADFDGDTILDVAIASAANLQFMKGNGDGTFAAPSTVASAAPSVTALYAADFNADGKRDLLAVWSDHAQAFLNAGATFTPAGTVLNSPAFPANLAGDGKSSVLACFPDASTGIPRLYQFAGNGDGTFQSAMVLVYSSAAGVQCGVPVHGPAIDYYAYTLAGIGNNIIGGSHIGQTNLQITGAIPNGPLYTADFDGDGIEDVVADFGGRNPYGIGYQLEGGLFTKPNAFSDLLPYPLGHPLAAGDFDNDGNADVLGGGVGTTVSAIMCGNGDGRLRAPRALSGNLPQPIGKGDFNHDGKLDFVSLSSGTITVYVNAK